MAYERILKDHDTATIPIGQQSASEFRILSQASDYEPTTSEPTTYDIIFQSGFLELETTSCLVLLETGGSIILEGY